MTGQKSEGPVNAGEALMAMTALQHLADLLRDGAELDRLIDGYLETRRLLAKAFKGIARKQLRSSEAAMDMHRSRIVEQMRAQYDRAVPDDVIYVRTYGETHSLLLAYFADRVGQYVSAGRLRILTGDQVHTERRIRELRDLGYAVETARISGDVQYCLQRPEPDLRYAAFVQLRANIKQAKGMSVPLRRALLDAVVAP